VKHTRAATRSLLTAVCLAGLVGLSTVTPAFAGGTVASGASACSDEELAHRAYSVMLASNDLYVFDTLPSLRVRAHVDGLRMPAGVAVGDHGRRLYVGEWGSGNIRVLDACSLTTVAALPVGGYNYVTQSGGRYLYVAVLGRGISVIDTTSDTIARTFTVVGLDGAVGLAPDGHAIYALTPLGIEPLDPMTGKQIAPTIPTGTRVPTWDAPSPDGRRLYTADTGGDSLSVIDLAAGRITKTADLPLQTTPIVNAVSPNGSQVWMANGAPSHGVTVFASDGSLIKVIATEGLSPGISFSRDGAYAYVLDGGKGCDVAGLGAVNLVIAADGVCNSGAVRIFRTSTLTQVGSDIPVGKMPSSLALVFDPVADTGQLSAARGGATKMATKSEGEPARVRSGHELAATGGVEPGAVGVFVVAGALLLWATVTRRRSSAATPR
jgi:DNA-binding beta-propeller fold protein YncE